MFCKNCGNDVNEKAVACPKCGVNPRSEKNFCQHCGEATNPKQVVCVKCGLSLKSEGFSISTGNMGKVDTDSIMNNKPLLYALIASGVGLLSVFLPWIKASASFMGYSASSSAAGISSGSGMFGILLILAGAFMAYKNIKWAFICGAVNILNGLSCMFGFTGGASTSYGGAKVSPQIGLILFLVSAIVFCVFTFKRFREEN